MNQEKEYFAFISYQRKDEEWADRLRNKLEHYRLPSSVRKKDVSLPKEIRPIFRDALELAGGVLAKEIEAALQQSKYLIVICSPNSAKSPWVNKEIKTFIDLGREGRIIPFIIDGTPFSDNPDTECFPPALRSLKGEKELLGININELSRDAASIKVVARMFGLKFDTLWQRYEREKKRKRWMIIGSVALLAIVALVVAGFFMNMSRTISQQNTSLLKAAERMQADSILQAQHIKRITEDSISLAQQNDSIQRQYALIEQQKDEIATERDNVKSANYAMKVNLSRILAERASALVDEGDSYLARLIALQALPPNLPYTSEAERIFRRANMNNNMIVWYRNKIDYCEHVSFSPDGHHILIKGVKYGMGLKEESCWWVLDAKTGIQVGELYKGDDVRFGRDTNTLVIVSEDKVVNELDIETGEMVNGPYKTHANVKSHAFINPNNNYLITFSKDNTIAIWDAITDRQIGRDIKGDNVFFSTAGKFFVSIIDSVLSIWNIKTGHQVGKSFYGTWATSNLDDKYIVAGTMDYGLEMYDTKTGEKIWKIPNAHSGKINEVDFSPNGHYFATASEDNTVKIWDIDTGQQFGIPLTGHTSSVNDLNFSPDGNYIVTASDDFTVRIWDVSSRQQVGELLMGHKGFVKEASFAPNGDYVLSASSDIRDGSIRIWDIRDKINKRVYRTSKGVKCNLNSFIYDIQRNSCICIENKKIKVTQSYVKELLDVKNKVYRRRGSITSENGQFEASGYFSTIYVKDNKTGHIFLRLPEGLVYSFSPNNKYLLLTLDQNARQVCIWNLETGRQVGMPLEGHTGGINSARFSPDGKYIITASFVDSTIKVWNAKTGKQACPSLEQSGVIYADFSEDGRYIITISNDKTGKIWEFPHLQQLIDETRERFKNRPLTLEERQKYYLD